MNRYEYDWFRWHIQVCIASICKHLCWPMWWSRYIYSTPLSKITVTPWTKGLWFQSLITWTRFDVDKQLCGTKQLPSQFITVQFFSAWTRLILWCLALWHHKNSDGSHSSPGKPWVHCGLAECTLYRPRMWPGHQQKHWTCRTQQEE